MHSVWVKNKRCARSWTFQPPFWPLCLLLLMLSGFITSSLYYLMIIEPSPWGYGACGKFKEHERSVRVYWGDGQEQLLAAWVLSKLPKFNITWWSTTKSINQLFYDTLVGIDVKTCVKTREKIMARLTYLRFWRALLDYRAFLRILLCY